MHFLGAGTSRALPLRSAMTMRRARFRRAMAVLAGALVLPALTITGVGLPRAMADDSGRSSEALGPGRPVELTVEHTPAPARRAAKAGSYQAFPVPTSSAGLGRIATAPNGDMWFLGTEKNILGRITRSGAIDEFNLPFVTAGYTASDLDIDASGAVWVAYDYGTKVLRYHPLDAGPATVWNVPASLSIRVGPDAVWMAGSTAAPGVRRIAGGNLVEDPNSPDCDGAIGRGRDGLMWCQQFDRLVQVNAAGSGGVAYPLPATATYPYSIAAGPNGKIWFGRDSGGTWITSPSNGNIGWVGDNGQVTTIRTGDRTAPRSLVTGPDGNVWFTSVGAAKGIGHVNAAGAGAVVQVGNYEPTALTYGADGAIWFTDKANNSIVRVPRENLWVTNVNVGPNSQLSPHAQPPVTVKKKVKADRKRKKATLTIGCGNGPVACSGTVVVKAGKAKVASGAYAVAVSSSGKVSVKLTKAGRKLLRRSRSVKVKVVLTAATGAQTTKKATLTR